MAWEAPVQEQLWDVASCPARETPGHFCTKVCADAYGGLPLAASAPIGYQPRLEPPPPPADPKDSVAVTVVDREPPKEVNCRCCTGEYKWLTRMVCSMLCKTTYDVCCCREDCTFLFLLPIIFAQSSPIWVLAILHELLAFLLWLFTFGWGFTRCWGWKYQIRVVKTYTRTLDSPPVVNRPSMDMDPRKNYHDGVVERDWQFAPGSCCCPCTGCCAHWAAASETPVFPSKAAVGQPLFLYDSFIED